MSQTNYNYKMNYFTAPLSNRFFNVFIVLLVCSTGAFAQVNKCVDGKGGISYSETPCESLQQGKQILGRDATASDPERDAFSRQQHRESLNRTMQQQRDMIDGYPPPLPQRSSVEKIDKPVVERDVEGCETYSSTKGCIGGERSRNPNWSPSKGYFGGGGPADQRRANEEARRAASSPGQMNCDRAGCWGSQNGVRYNRAAGGNLIGTNGQFCIRAGNTFSCN
jgi:hypothetical protein